MKIKPSHVLVLALMGSSGAWAASGANASLPFNSSLAPFFPAPFFQDDLDATKLPFKLEKELSMIALDALVLPPAHTVQLVVRNETRGGVGAQLQKMHRMGVCMAVSSYPGAQIHLGNVLDADAAAANYYFEYEHKKRIDTTNARISFVVQPQHGQIIQKPNDTLYYYKPNEGYQGKDRVEALVEGDGYKVRVVYDILSGLSDVDIGNEESWREGVPNFV